MMIPYISLLTCLNSYICKQEIFVNKCENKTSLRRKIHYKIRDFHSTDDSKSRTRYVLKQKKNLCFTEQNT